MSSKRWQKGKQRAYTGAFQGWQRRDDSTGTGGGDGIVVELQYVGTTAYNAGYTLPLLVGSNNVNVSLQIDTGSSDLWVTSSSCSSSSCGSVPSDKRYDPSSSSTSSQSGSPFNLTYLQGQAIGSIDWDSVNIGGYSIDTQAFGCVASTVNSEPLSEYFDGVLGLALPDNSVISQAITPTSSNAPDGAQFTSNLFSLSPPSLSPAARFLSLTLSRPGSSTIPSLFGIGKHPSQSQVPQIGDGGNIQYSTVLDSLTSDGVASLFWKSNIENITVWVDGQAKPIALQNSSSGYPSAILDTGVPVILATKVIADAIYGAIGVTPASDGNYYVGCKTPLNLTISLDNRSPISVHPLDLTTPPPTSSSSSNCIGLIQAADSSLNGAADMILGVPFIRNTYMVMAYQAPDSNGSFPDVRPDDNPQSPTNTILSNQLYPHLGLQGLTNATVALDEFQKVRVMGLPIDGSQTVITSSGKKISTGLDVLFGLLGFFALCFFLFGIRYCIMRRKYPKLRPVDDHKDLGRYELTGRTSPTGGAFLSEDAHQEMRYTSYLKNERSANTFNSDHTRVGDVEDGMDGEMGWKKKIINADEKTASDARDVDWDPSPGPGLDWNQGTLVGLDSPRHQQSSLSQESAKDLSLSPELRHTIHRRESSDDIGSRSSRRQLSDDLQGGHGRGPSLSFPLLQPPETALTHDIAPFERVQETALGLDLGEFGGMAGIGTGRRNGKLRSESLDISEVGDIHSSFSGQVSSSIGIERPSSSLSTSVSERGRLHTSSGSGQSPSSSASYL